MIEQFGKTDWQWCRDNPEAAAKEIDRLRLALRSIANSTNANRAEILDFAHEQLAPSPLRDTF